MKNLTVLNLGAGVQSTCLYLMACEGATDTVPDCAIFADTGWEPKAVYEHLERLMSVQGKHKIPIHVVSRGNLREDVLKHIARWRKDGGGWSGVGQPPFYVIQPVEQVSVDLGLTPDRGGKLWRQCTKEYKIEPIKKAIRDMLGFKKGDRVKDSHVNQWFGISLDEMGRTRESQDKWITNVYPLIDKRMTRHNCNQWLKRYGWMDVPKSSCLGCPYHSDKHWREMKKERPDEWADVVEFDKVLRDGKYPKATGDVYMHKSMKPLGEIDFDNAEDRGQLTMWVEFEEECEGLCGI